MSNTPKELKYTKSHEWVRMDDGVVTIGITQHAQEMLGDIVFVELPEEGESVTQGEEFGVVESVKAAADVYAPVSGTVVAVNTALEDSPSQVNSHPYDDGWMVRIEMADESELEELIDADEYSETIEEE